VRPRAIKALGCQGDTPRVVQRNVIEGHVSALRC
jgi:hypothetical protein